jgi:hypothetical protein
MTLLGTTGFFKKKFNLGHFGKWNGRACEQFDFVKCLSGDFMLSKHISKYTKKKSRRFLSRVGVWSFRYTLVFPF